MGLLEGKVVVVTGAGAGVGKGIAMEAARQGAKVVVNDLGVNIDGSGGSNGPAQDTVNEIVAAGGTASANTDSVAEWKSAQAIVRQAVELYGRVDAVVNNAGNLRDGIFHKMPEEDFDAVIKVHLKGCFNMSRAAAPHFKSEESGVFVHMTSTSGLIGNFGQANYCAAKLGIVGLSKAIALDMERFNVRSNCIAPFAFTRMVDTIPSDTPDGAERMKVNRRLEAAKIAPFTCALLTDAGQGRDRADLRRAQQRDLSVLAAAAHSHRPCRGRRLDRGDLPGARAADDAAVVLRAGQVEGCVLVGSRLNSARRSGACP